MNQKDKRYFDRCSDNCEGCKVGVRSTWNPVTKKWGHVLNDDHVPCEASDYRNKYTKIDKEPR